MRSRIVATMVAATILIGGYAAVQGGGGTLACSQTLTDRAAVNTFLTSSGSAGQIGCVTADITGSAITTTVDMASEARLVALPMDGSVAMVDFTCNGCSNITIDGFEFTGETGITTSGAVSALKIVRNNFHDQQRSGVRINGSGHDGIQILANTFKDLNCPAGQCSGSTSSGYGVNSDATQTNFKFSYNDCSAPTAKTADCIELGSVDGAELIGNNIHDMPDAGEAHGDGIMIWDTSQDVLVQDNRLVDVLGSLMSPDTDRLTMRNNLIARAAIRCVDADNNGTSGEIQPLDWEIDNNTFVNCGFEAWMMDGESLTGRGSNIFTDNILQRETAGTNFDITAPVAGCRDATFETFTGNVLSSAQTCGLSTVANAFSQTTTWGDTTNYVPTNLPGGYTNAGYRLAPNGPSACGTAQGCAAEPTEGGGGGFFTVQCDSSVNTRAALQSALDNTANSGQTVCVTADITGSRLSVTANMTSEAEFVAQPADGTISLPGVTVSGTASDYLFYGFEFTGLTDAAIDMGGATNIHWAKINCHDQQGTCMVPGGTGTWYVGSKIERIEYTDVYPQGYGIGPGSFDGNGTKISYNYCDGGGDTGLSDCMEVSMDNFEFIGNVMHNAHTTFPLGHSDTFMIWNQSNNGIIKDNRAWDGGETLISPTNDSLTIENNLVTDHNQCISSQGSGTVDEPHRQPSNWTVKNNTVWTCGGSGTWNFHSAANGSTGNNTAQDNLVAAFSCSVDSLWSSPLGGNVFGDGSNCLTSDGNNSYNFTPTWSNSSDPFSQSYYIPTNLPGSFTDAGYRYAPAGPDNCPVELCKYG